MFKLNTTMRLALLFFVSCTVGSLAETNAVNYRLDLKTPANFASRFPDSPPPPSRIDVYKTGPELESYDLEWPSSLSSRKPDSLITNKTEIEDLTSALKETVLVRKVPNVPIHTGYKYHLLLYNDESKTVMQFRVFEFTDTNTVWSYVRPRSDTGFGYFNSKVVPWLKQQNKLNAPTNSTRGVNELNSTRQP